MSTWSANEALWRLRHQPPAVITTASSSLLHRNFLCAPLVFPPLLGVSGVFTTWHSAWSDGLFSGACEESLAGPWNHNNPFPVPILVPAPGPPQTRLCPHENYLPPSSHPRCFQPSFQNSMPSLLHPGWLFSPSCLEYSGILSSSKVEKRRSSPPYVYLFLNSDNHPERGFLTEERRCILETDRLEHCLCELHFCELQFPHL